MDNEIITNKVNYALSILGRAGLELAEPTNFPYTYHYDFMLYNSNSTYDRSKVAQLMENYRFVAGADKYVNYLIYGALLGIMNMNQLGFAQALRTLEFVEYFANLAKEFEGCVFTLNELVDLSQSK